MHPSMRPKSISAPSSKTSIIAADCTPRSATNPRLSSKPNCGNRKPSERTQPRLCHSNPVSQPRGAVQMLQLRSQETLDGGDHKWLKARHHFVVSADGNPANGPLGALVVWNDDQIAPGAGF